MYVQQTNLEVAPKKLELWLPHARNQLSVLARQSGLVSVRMLRAIDNANRFLFLRTWRDKEAARQVLASAEVQHVDKPLMDPSLYKSSVEMRDFELLDMVWGRSGPSAFSRLGVFLNHIEFEVVPEKFDNNWRPYARNFLSVIARQPELVAEEILRSTDNPHRCIAIRSYAGKENSYIGPEWKPSIELKLSTKPAEDWQVYDHSKFPPKYTDCQVADMVWGPSGAKDYEDFMDSLVPV